MELNKPKPQKVKCKVCNVWLSPFSITGHLVSKRHRLKQHDIYKETMLSRNEVDCDYCNKTYSSWSNYVAHLYREPHILNDPDQKAIDELEERRQIIKNVELPPVALPDMFENSSDSE